MTDQPGDNQNNNSGQDIDALLQDPAKRVEIIQRLGMVESAHLTPGGMTGGSTIPTPFGMFTTPSGTFSAPRGSAPLPTPWFPYSPFPSVPFLWINPQQHLATPTGGTPTATEPSTNGKD